MTIAMRLKSLIPTILFFLTSSVCVQAQCVQKISDIPAAPELLGFRLGMNKDDVKVRVPQTRFGKPDNFGVSKTTINPYFDPTIDKTKFEGVRSVSLDLLDERVTSLWIGYDETFKIQDVDEFVKFVSSSLKVSGAWSTWKGRGFQLRCADFQLVVSRIAGGPSLRISDTAAEDVVATRRQAKEEMDSAAELAASEESTPEIVGDKKAKVYYPPGCSSAKDVSEINRILFKTTEEAEKAGFKLAKTCN